MKLAGLSGDGILSKVTEELLVELTDQLLRLQVPNSGQDEPAAVGSAAEDAGLLGVLGRLQELVTKLRLAASHPGAYVVVVRRGQHGPSFAAWLMSPAVIFDTFAIPARTVVLASGTLAPMAALLSELAPSSALSERSLIAGPLEASHVVVPAQVMVATLGRFLGCGRTLIGTFDNWKRPDFMRELGFTVVGLIQSIPGGVLCFFPSYAVLEGCVTAWRSVPASSDVSVWASLSRVKGAVVIEPRSSAELPLARAVFVNAVQSGAGAICLAVYRGKMSEGLSFDDALCRGVLCLGVPYPHAKDPLVVAKRRWNDAVRGLGDRGRLSGECWYELQAYRAVNQALGRCIRHRFDYGSLILLDARWACQGDRARGLRRHLARWMQPMLEDWPSQALQSVAASSAVVRAGHTMQRMTVACAAGGHGGAACTHSEGSPAIAGAVSTNGKNGNAGGVDTSSCGPGAGFDIIVGSAITTKLRLFFHRASQLVDIRRAQERDVAGIHMRASTATHAAGTTSRQVAAVATP